MKPAPVVGFRRRHRVSGEPYLHAVVGEELTIPAGSKLDLRRLNDGSLDSPEFALLIVTPSSPWKPTKAERARVDADRLDGGAIRSTEGASW